MVPPRRRAAKQAVSYNEGNSESDDSQDDSFTETSEVSPEPQQQHAQRSRGAPQRTAPSTTSARTRRQPRRMYAEDSSESESDSDFDSEEDGEKESGPVVVPKVRAPTARSRGRASSKKTTNASPRKAAPARRAIRESSPLTITPRQPRATGPKIRGPTQADLWFMGKQCPWTELPFEILRDILSYASYPLFDDRGQATPHVRWLLSLRNTHPALLEASLAALYYTPPITNTAMAHQFLALMNTSTNRTTNYNVKVRHLEVEARSTLLYSAGAELGALDLGAMVKQLPQLLGIDIWSVMDNPEVRRRGLQSRSWSYSDSLFEALAQGSHRLRHYHWNARFMGKHASDPLEMYTWMDSIHQLPAFQSLTYIKLTGFLGDSTSRLDLAFPVDFVSPGKTLTITQQNKEAARIAMKALQEKQDERLAKALQSLPNLRKLDLYLCSVVDGDWLQLLPGELTHLGIIECDRITSDGLQAFLSSRGQHLKVLVLNLNPELNISFLTTLAETCPHLEELSVDLTSFRKPDAGEVASTGDYGYLLQPDEKPTWPKSLQTLCMNHLQHWPLASAEMFFTSLIESAQDLPDLRRLLLSVSLDVSWRERAKMRDLWEDKFNRVFLRKPKPPNPHWWSIRAYKAWKDNKVAEVVISPPKPEIKSTITGTIEETATDDESDMPVRNGKRKAPAEAPTRRLRPRKNMSEDEDEEPVSTLGGSLRDMVMQTLEMHIQGMCDEVDVRIDNLRPREEQFHESDFLDSEPSGDEEWNGVDLDFEELYPKGYRRAGKARKGKARSGW